MKTGTVKGNAAAAIVISRIEPTLCQQRRRWRNATEAKLARKARANVDSEATGSSINSQSHEKQRLPIALETSFEGMLELETQAYVKGSHSAYRTVPSLGSTNERVQHLSFDAFSAGA